MKVILTDRAKERGLKKVELLERVDLENSIAGVIYEKRFKDGEMVEWLDPIIIFKKPMKQGRYDQIVRLAEELGVVLVFPEPNNFRTDYYGLDFDGHKSLVKSWGYTSNHLPPTKRWGKERIKSAAKEWISDTVVMAKVVEFLDQYLDDKTTEEIREEFYKHFEVEELVS